MPTQLQFGMPVPKLAKRNAAQRESDPRIKALVKAFYDKVGYKCPTWGKESVAAARLLNAPYAVHQVMECYDYLKLTEFWKDKPVSLMTILTQIGEWVKLGEPMKPAPTKAELAAMPRWKQKESKRQPNADMDKWRAANKQRLADALEV